jgi:hypothetical protein
MVRGLRKLHRALIAVIAPLALAIAGAPAAEAAAAPAEPGRAVFGTTELNLAEGWGAARSCVVYSRTNVRCYATNDQADAALGYQASADPMVNGLVAAVPACASGWLCLYELTNGGGRRLQFRDEFWNYLSDYAFERKTSSWRNNQGSSDTGHLSLYNRTTPYTCGANTYALTMGAYDNQAYAVWG